MPVTDSVSDYLTRVRNAVLAKHRTVEIPHSKLKENISKILEKEGYILGYSLNEEKFKSIVIKLKYLSQGEVAIKKTRRISSPGQRVYQGKEIGKYLSGLGFYVLSTSQGVMTDKEARVKRIGGEVLFSIY